MRVALRGGDIIAKKATTIAIVNQKGGTAKTTTCENLGIGLAMEGKKVLLVDVDPQGSLTISMGWQQPDELPTTLSTLMQKAMNDQPIQPGEGILHHAEGVDLIPANIELAGMEVALVNSMNREKMLKQVLDSAKREYDYILLDCTPSLGITKSEKSRIYEKMLSMGIRSLSAYIRKMALDGYCLHLDLQELRRMAYLLQMCSTNLNQYAKRANECGQVYAADVEDLRTRLDELIDIGKQILSRLADL